MSIHIRYRETILGKKVGIWRVVIRLGEHRLNIPLNINW